MKHLMSYVSDKGVCVINGVCFANGAGDGNFDIYFDSEKSNLPYANVWFDLRCSKLKIWQNDCDKKMGVATFTREDLGCDAVCFNFKDGDVIIQKYF